jgi:hypothetical protein
MLKKLALALSLLLAICHAHAGDFVDLGDGTVFDRDTNLVWQQTDDNTYKTWQLGLDYCNGLSLAGHDDWVLPNIKELESLVDTSNDTPALDDTKFPGTELDYYWSSTSYSSDASDAWQIHFLDGRVIYGRKNDGYNVYVRCVR